MEFQIGEQIVFLNEAGGGFIRSIKNELFFVEDESGFERPFPENELGKVHGTDYKSSASPKDKFIADITSTTIQHTVKKENRTGYLKPIDVWEVDLHIESLSDSHNGMSNAQILNRQMSMFKSFFANAKSKNIRKLIVIHGVGEGVLKQEIRTLLSKLEGVEYFDASFADYGKGATQIELRHNN
jgi:hypothetical protein